MQESSLAKIPQVDVKLELDYPRISRRDQESHNAAEGGKSPGIDGIPAEVYQHGGETVLSKLKDLFTNCWEKETLRQDLRDAVIVSVQKQGRKIRLFKLPKHHSALHCRQNLGSRLAE